VLEKYIQRAIIEFLNYHGCWCWRNNAGAIPVTGKNGKKRVIKVGRAGESDIFGIHKASGVFISFEVKVPKRKNMVTEVQKDFLRNVSLCGGYCGVVTSPEEALSIIEKGKPGIVYGIDQEIPS
jgi:hypothetical protein